MKTKPKTKSSLKSNGRSYDLRDRIAARAYEMYLQEGRPVGRELQHWLAAEAELLEPVPVRARVANPLPSPITPRAPQEMLVDADAL